jgi:hypothetical protein
MGFKQYLGELVGQAGLFHRNASDDPVPSGVANPLPAALYGKGTNPGDTAQLLDANGRVPVVGRGILSIGTGTTASPVGFAEEGGTGIRPTATVPYIYDGVEQTPLRGNTEGTLLASAARTVSTLSPVQTNHNARGGVLAINITARTVGISPLVRLEIMSEAGTTILQSADFDPLVGEHFLVLYPGAGAAAVGASYSRMLGVGSLPLKRKWSAYVRHVADVTDLTYSLTADMIL